MRLNPDRLAKLKELAILDTAPEVVFDDLTRAVAEIFGVPIAMVNLLDAQRDWFKSCLGLPMTESAAETSFCEVFLTSSHSVIVVEDTTRDPRFSSHPLVVNPPEIRFYAAARLVVDGETVGTLCAYDTKPRHVSREQIDKLELLSKAAMESLAARISSY